MFHSRQAFANAFTVVLTAALLLLIGFAVNAQAVTPGDFSFATCPTGKPYAGTKRAPLAVGFVTDQFQIAKYQRKVGTRNRLGFYSNFEAWAKNRDPRQAFQQGNLNRVLPYVTWEPWENVPNDANQSQPQPEWTNASIASGAHDDYIRSWAAAVKANGRPVYLRLAHEMNGTSYPWSLDPQSYVAASGTWSRSSARPAPATPASCSPSTPTRTSPATSGAPASCSTGPARTTSTPSA
jgi:hypothetical protein